MCLMNPFAKFLLCVRLAFSFSKSVHWLTNSLKNITKSLFYVKDTDEKTIPFLNKLNM